ncbi:alpha/beta hydrolase [Brachybacterium ginsengisoli]|uniref:Alpha/beta hydrolase n=1 Tax=Brachybacterium ginsengisoli TaxID=1331682 RepID=A0A291H0K3_9MICO|nr:alpha/beta hydrolase [Brachybacterium ginsengisoli]ATG55930.1 alpha/beta hydrolase [Brachybacterium ginsengisoli]
MTARPAHSDARDLTVLGGPVRLYTAGESGPPVLLLHGAMLDTAQGIWHDMVPALAAHHRVHVLDMPRHGASRPWSGWLGDEFYTRFLRELLDVLELEKVAIMGLSMGGGTGYRFALAHPERVSALIAVNPGGLGERRPYQLVTWLFTRAPGLLRATTWCMDRWPAMVRSSLTTHLSAGERTPGVERIVRLAVQEAREKERYGERALDDWQVDWYGPLRTRFGRLEEFSRLTVPTLWVHGAEDPLISREEMVAADAASPDSRFVEIPDAGHLLPYDQPARLAELALEHLARR